MTDEERQIGRANATSSGPWGGGEKWLEIRSIVSFGSTLTLKSPTLKKKVGNFVGGVLSPWLSHLYLTEVDKRLERAKEVTRQGKYTSIE